MILLLILNYYYIIIILYVFTFIYDRVDRLKYNTLFGYKMSMSWIKFFGIIIIVKINDL